MAKVALDMFAGQICNKYIPTLIEHDPNKQIGVLLYGKVAQLEDEEFALYIVSGIFENSRSPNSLFIREKAVSTRALML